MDETTSNLKTIVEIDKYEHSDDIDVDVKSIDEDISRNRGDEDSRRDTR